MIGGNELIISKNWSLNVILNECIISWNNVSISSGGLSYRHIVSHKNTNELNVALGLKFIALHKPRKASRFSGESFTFLKLIQKGLIKTSMYLLTSFGLASDSLPIQIDKFWARDFFI